MDIAGHLQWIVPLAVVLVGALVAASRGVVTYSVDFSVFTDTAGNSWSGIPSRIGSAKIILMNTSHRHLSDVKIGFSPVEVISFGRFRGSSLGHLQIPEREGKLLTLGFPEMPASEVITLDVLYAEATLLGFAGVSGGGNRYRVVERKLNTLERRGFWLQVGTVAIAGAFVTWLVLNS